MIKINKTLNTNFGAKLPTGSVLKFGSTFVANSSILRFAPILVFRSEQALEDFNNAGIAEEDKVQPIPGNNIKELSHIYERELTPQEFMELETQSGIFSKVEGWLVLAIVQGSNEELVSADLQIV